MGFYPEPVLLPGQRDVASTICHAQSLVPRVVSLRRAPPFSAVFKQSQPGPHATDCLVGFGSGRKILEHLLGRFLQFFLVFLWFVRELILGDAPENQLLGLRVKDVDN